MIEQGRMIEQGQIGQEQMNEQDQTIEQGQLLGVTGAGADSAAVENAGVGQSPGDQLRALPNEAERRGTRFVSAQAMQARLFSVYDAAAAAEDALDLVQRQLTLTLDRHYYDAGEIEAMAAELDALLALGHEAEPSGVAPEA